VVFSTLADPNIRPVNDGPVAPQFSLLQLFTGMAILVSQFRSGLCIDHRRTPNLETAATATRPRAGRPAER